MAQVKLNNGTRRNSVVGQLVRVDPKNPKNFIAVEIGDIDVIGTVAEVRSPGNPTVINLINHSSSSGSAEAFETVSKNLKSYPYTITYGIDGIDEITYDLGGGQTIVKTFNYTLGVLTSIVLSGDTPDGILLTKELSYTGDDLTAVTYS